MARRSSKPLNSLPLKRDIEAPLVSRPIQPRDPRQPRLPFDPMPERIEPCLALLSSKVPSGDNWIYELKWDGYRLAIHVETNGVRILTRGGHDWTHRFPEIAKDASALGPATMILDGEAVVLDEQGKSDFGALQKALGGRGGKRSAAEAVLYAFDLLYFHGHDTTGLDLHDRRQMLFDLLDGETGHIRLSEAIDADGDDLLRNGVPWAWKALLQRMKTCHIGRDEPAIGSKSNASKATVSWWWVTSRQRRWPEPSQAICWPRGRARNWFTSEVWDLGFKRAEAVALKRQLDGMRTANPAVRLKNKKLVFTEPTLVAENRISGVDE